MKQDEPNERARVEALQQKREQSLETIKAREALRADIQALRQRRHEVGQDVSRLELGISELRSQIVSSPDKLRSRIDEMHDMLQREMERLKETEVKERQTTNKINALAQYSIVRPSRCSMRSRASLTVSILSDAGTARMHPPAR